MAPPEEQQSSLGTGRLVRGLVLGTVVGLLVYAGLVFWGDWESVRSSLGQLRARTVLECLGLVLAGYALRFARWEVYRGRAGLPLGRLRSLLVFLSGLAFTVSPGKLGEAFKSVLLKEETGAGVSHTAPIVLAERLTDLLALLLLVSVANLEAEEHRWILPVAASGSIALLLLLASPRVADAGLAVLARVSPARRLVPKLEAAARSVRSLLAPGPLTLAVLLATGAWSLECLAAWRIAHGLGLEGPALSAITAAFSLSLVAGAVALFTPGGLGVTEGLLTEHLRRQYLGAGASSALARGTATSATLLTRLVTLWLAVLIGLLALALHRRGVGRAKGPASGG